MRGSAVVAVLLVVVFSAAVILFIVSGEGPQVRIDTPDDGSTVSGIVDIAGEAYGAGEISSVQVKIDSGGWMAANLTLGNNSRATWTTTWNTTSVPDGPHKIAASVRDATDQTGQTTIDVIVANPPWVEILAPANGTIVNGIQIIAGDSGDPSAGGGVQLVQVSVDPSPSRPDWRNATPVTPDWSQWTFEWNTTSVETGSHAVVARAFDGDLYSAPWGNLYTVDNRPYVRVVHPRGNLTPLDVVHGFFLVHGTAGYLAGEDPLVLVQIRIDNGAWVNATDTSPDATWSTWAYQWNSTQYPDGEHEMCAQAWDGRQYSAPVCARALVNNGCGVPPTVSIGDPFDGQTVRGLFLIHGNATDDCCGVWLVQVSIEHNNWDGATDTSPDASWTTWAKAWDTRRWDDGCLDISARAWDGTMFSPIQTITVCVDNRENQPEVSFQNLSQGQTVSGLYLFHGYTGDTPGVQLVEVQLDGGEWQQASDTGRVHPWSSWAFEWNTSAVLNGDHIVCARARDGDLYSEPLCVTVDVQNRPGGAASPTSDLLKASLISLGLPGWLTDIFLWLLSAGYVPVAIVSVIPAILLWLRSRGYLRK